MTPLFKKLNLGSHDKVLVLSAPPSFEPELAQLDAVNILRTGSDGSLTAFAIGFAITQSDLDQISTELIQSTGADAILWVAYPKRSSKKYRCEFDRDHGWTVLGNAGFEPVRQVAIDEDWSALRFRRAELIKRLTRSSEMSISQEGKRRTKR